MKGISKGTEVFYYLIIGEGGNIKSRIRTEVFRDRAGQPVVFLEGVRGYVHLDHVLVIEGKE